MRPGGHVQVVGTLIVTLLLLVSGCQAGAGETGRAQLRLDAGGIEIDVFTYRPDCDQPSVLFVFHGVKRNAKSYRNKATEIADGACLMVFSPRFDKDRFPNWRYHRAGVVRDGRVQSRSQYTAPVLRSLVEQARTLVGTPGASVYFFGHSAGGQFLSRMTAYTPLDGVDRVVIANPSVHVVPLVDESAPYGFGGFASGTEAQARIKDYLAAPITIYLGREDKGSKHLVDNAPARRQGKHRLQRGRTIYAMAKALADEQGWPFGWRLVEVPEVGHSSKGMLRSPKMYRALGLSAPVTSRLRTIEPVARETVTLDAAARTHALPTGAEWPS